MNNYKTIGILGGMGPMATYDLGMKIIENTEASCDREHIPVLIDSNTRIPDRTEAILYGGEDPFPELLRSARVLETAGADFLIIPCNTSHYYYDRLCDGVGIPIIHMPRETAARLAEMGVKKAAVLATDGTCRSGIYDRALADVGIEPVYPSEESQKVLMSLVYDYVKADIMDFDDLNIAGVIEELKAAGAEILILGCTELPIAFDHMSSRISAPDTCNQKDGGSIPGILPAIDPTEVLARAAVLEAGGRLRETGI